MVAYCSKDQKHSCQRATSFHKDILEQEFQCYGAGAEVFEELLQYMDLSMEEASAIWEDMDVVSPDREVGSAGQPYDQDAGAPGVHRHGILLRLGTALR